VTLTAAPWSHPSTRAQCCWSAPKWPRAGASWLVTMAVVYPDGRMTGTPARPSTTGLRGCLRGPLGCQAIVSDCSGLPDGLRCMRTPQPYPTRLCRPLAVGRSFRRSHCPGSPGGRRYTRHTTLHYARGYQPRSRIPSQTSRSHARSCACASPVHPQRAATTQGSPSDLPVRTDQRLAPPTARRLARVASRPSSLAGRVAQWGMSCSTT